jgi:transcription termination factor NusB
MAISDSKRRELLSLLAYRQLFESSEPEQSIGVLMETLAVTRKNAYEAIAWWNEAAGRIGHIKKDLAAVSRAYAIDRLGKVEQAILFVAADELLQKPTESKRIINDAIRLARKYASPEAGALVNALLDGLSRLREGGNVDETMIEASVQALEQAEADAQEALHMHDPRGSAPS